MFKFPVRAGLLGLPICLLVTLIAFGESAPRIERQLEATAQSLMEPFPGVEISVDGRDITLAGEPQRAAGDGLDVAVALLRATEGVRRVEVGFDTGPIVAEPPAPPKPEELAGRAAIDPTKPLTIDLNSASRVDFAAVIQASVLPEWEPNEDDDPCFIAFGDDINTEFAACISADRKNLTLKNDDKFEYLAYDFSAPRPYRIEIEINDAESVVRVDGVIAGTLPIGLIAPSTRVLNIGSLDGVASQFAGKVGRVRVWNRGSLDLLTGIADTDAAPGWQAGAPGFTPHYDNLVLYSRIGAQGGLDIVMPAAKTDPVGMWYTKDESPVDHITPPPLLSLTGKPPLFNEAPYGNYSSYKILKVERSLPDGGLIATSDSGGAPPFWVKPVTALSGRFTRESDGVYRAGGRATGEKGGAATSTTLYLFTPDLLNLDGGVSLARFELDPDGGADAAKKDPWDSTFVNPEQIKNSFYSFAGFDITRMNPVNLGDLEGVRAPVFAKPLPGSTNYKATGEGRYAPASHFFRPIFSAEEVNSVETTKSELELRDNLARSLGLNIGLEKVGSFGASKSFARKKTALTASEFQHGYGESRVLHYSLILDKSKAELAPGFRDAVLELARKSDDAALDAFVQRFGTHYPYAVTYGGKVHMEFRKTYSVNKSGVDRDDQFKAEANAELEGVKAGGNVSKDTGTGNTASAESGIEVTNIFVSGGRGTASPDHLEIQDTVVPVYMDLRPVTELLSPVYFDDQAITWTLRNILETRIAAYRRKYENNSSSLAFAHYSVRVARVICVDDGDQTLDVSNLLAGSQIIMDPLTLLIKPIVEAVAGAAGAAMPVINDQPNVCELNGIASATLAEGTKLLDPQTRRAFADTNDSVTLTFFGMNISVSFYGAAGFGDRDARTKLETNSAFWIAPVPPEKTPLSVTEGWQFAAQPSTKGSELLLTIPRDQVSRYSLSLWASMSEVDTVDMVSGTTTKSSTPYSLWMFGSGKADLNNIGSEPFAITLKATGECKPNAMWACPEAPYASAIAGEVRVEFEIQKLD